jgi:hypothetical protein
LNFGKTDTVVGPWLDIKYPICYTKTSIAPVSKVFYPVTPHHRGVIFFAKNEQKYIKIGPKLRKN